MNDRPKLLEKQFDGFMNAVGLARVPEIQRREMLRAFMAGARTYSTLLMEYSSAGDEVTGADMALCEALEREMEDFPKRVERGQA